MNKAFDDFERDLISAAIADRKFDKVPEEFWDELSRELKPKKRGAPKIDKPRYIERNIDICRKNVELRERGIKRKKIISDLAESFEIGEEAISKILTDFNKGKYRIDYVIDLINTRYTSIIINRIINKYKHNETEGQLTRAISHGLCCLGIIYTFEDVSNVIDKDIDTKDYTNISNDELLYMIASEIQSDISR